MFLLSLAQAQQVRNKSVWKQLSSTERKATHYSFLSMKVQNTIGNMHFVQHFDISVYGNAYKVS